MLELLILFLTSKSIIQALYTIFFMFFRKKELAMIPIYLLFFPGVVIHELSHFLVAEILFVHVYDINLIPQIKEGKIRLGNVQIRKTDILRRLIIGAAPVIAGIFILFIILTYFVGNFEISLSPINISKTLLIAWSLFAITNTMFSSKKDMEGFIEFSAIGGFFLLVIILASVIGNIDLASPVLSFLNNSAIQAEVKKISILFLIPLFINSFFFLSSKILIRK